jgi:hypothetical protein
MTDDDFVDLTPLVPMMLPPYWDEPEAQPQPRRSTPEAAPRTPYGLIGMPDNSIRVRDLRVFALGAGIAGVLTAVFSWFGRRRV